MGLGCVFLGWLQEGEPKWFTDYEMGGQGALARKANTMEKRTFCAHRVVEGDDPFCVVVCSGRARLFVAQSVTLFCPTRQSLPKSVREGRLRA